VISFYLWVALSDSFVAREFVKLNSCEDAFLCEARSNKCVSGVILIYLW